jgi:hypothetical protein
MPRRNASSLYWRRREPAVISTGGHLLTDLRLSRLGPPITTRKSGYSIIPTRSFCQEHNKLKFISLFAATTGVLWKQGAENIWTEEKWSDGWLEKTAQ